MNTCRVFVPYGALGAGGISQDAFERGLSLKPDIIASDCGSTDSGPFYLGTAKGKYTREQAKKEIRTMLQGGRKLGVPIALGSCDTSGTDHGVDEYADIVAEVCAEEGFEVKVAKIYTQQNAEKLKALYKAGKITPLMAAPEISEKTFDECSNIVALAGVEPFIKALEDGCDVVLCGRATDTAIIAAMPIMRGCNVAACWHGAKIAECGSLCATPTDGGVFLTFDEEGVTVEPTGKDNKCTPYTTSAHMLYENADPYIMIEPGVKVDVSEAKYEQITERATRITGSTFEPMPYTMKLEGSAHAGYQSLSIVGITDRRIMADPLAWIGNLEKLCNDWVQGHGITSGYSMAFKAYGFNAVTEEYVKPGSFIPREIGLVVVVTADTQELANKVSKMINPRLLHTAVRKDEMMPSFAFPFSPAEVQKGEIYEFRLNHVIHMDDPLEMVRIEYSTVGGK